MPFGSLMTFLLNIFSLVEMPLKGATIKVNGSKSDLRFERSIVKREELLTLIQPFFHPFAIKSREINLPYTSGVRVFRSVRRAMLLSIAVVVR